MEIVFPMDNCNLECTEDAVNLLKCLCSSLSDSEGKTLLKRHLLLMCHYLERRKNGIKLVDLPYLRIALEFFSANLIDLQQYHAVMLNCLKLLQKPVLMNKYSEGCFAVESFTALFSSLGNCLHLSGDTTMELMILDVILFLLTYERKNPDEVSLEIRREAVKNSFLPEIIASLMYFSSRDLYNSILDVLYQLSLQSYLANYFLSLNCMDFWIKNIPIKPNLSIREASIKETTSNLLWSVMRCRESYNDPVPTLSSQSLSVLRGWLRREVLFGKTYERNNVGVLLLQIFLSIPKLEVSRSGILADIGLLAVATEFGTQNTWASKAIFKPTKDNLSFKKILMTLLLLRFEDTVTKMVLHENRFLHCLSFLLEFPNSNHCFKWNKNQHIELINVCLYALPIISKHFKQEYTQSGATTRILQIIQYFSYKQQNLQLIKKCCLCLHLLVSSEISLDHFRVLNVTSVLMNLIFFLMEKLNMNLLVQTILTYCFCIITNLVQDHKPSKEDFGEEMKNLSLLILKRLENPHRSDSKISISLLISTCDFVWQSTVLNCKTRKLFIDDLGIYSILNVMEGAHLVVELLFLGMLTDLCTDPRCIPQIVTWRGKNINNNFISMLCVLWRKQESLKGVSRDENGCIKDIEVCLMGEKQMFTKITNFFGSPALVDMIGCARPKIAAINHIITRRHNEKVLLAKSIYHIPFDAISTKDEITQQIIMGYEELKEGEILFEVEKAVNKSNVTLLPLDITVLHELRMRQIGLANKIQKSQKQILEAKKKKELDEEEKLYYEINEVQLSSSLKNIFELDSYLTISNQHYKKLKHMKYEAFLNEMDILFDKRRNDTNFHKTFSHPRNFILVKTGRNAQITSIFKKVELTRALPIPEEGENLNTDTNNEFLPVQQ